MGQKKLAYPINKQVRGNYYVFNVEATVAAVNEFDRKAKIDENNEYKIMTTSFGANKILKVTSKYKLRPNGHPFSTETLEGIEEAQMFLSQGIIKGGRNILSHEELPDLKITGLFTEKNCLDMLSILSYLYERLDDA